jgi:hypothetical protein
MRLLLDTHTFLWFVLLGVPGTPYRSPTSPRRGDQIQEPPTPSALHLAKRHEETIARYPPLATA